MIYRILLYIFCLTFTYCVFGQFGGDNAYHFLNHTVGARASALGGQEISLPNDPNIIVTNPALLEKNMNNAVSLSYLNYVADINTGFASFIHDYKKIGLLSTSLKFIDYGEFMETDEGGNQLGKFSANEYALILGWAKHIDSNWSIGANFKPIYSSLYATQSFALAADVAVVYKSPDKNFTTSIVAKNIGRPITYYSENNRENLPFEIQWGMSKRLAHVPILLSVTGVHLQKWNITYTDSTEISSASILGQVEEASPNSPNIFDQMARHFIFGASFIPSKSFKVNAGYNFKRRRELTINEKPGLVGFSWGIEIRVKKFLISYASARYHLSGSSNVFSLSTNINQFVQK